MEKLFRCEMCGAVSKTKKKCCGVNMVDLTSSGCMSCRGCGHH